MLKAFKEYLNIEASVSHFECTGFVTSQNQSFNMHLYSLQQFNLTHLSFLNLYGSKVGKNLMQTICGCEPAKLNCEYS